LVWHNGEIIGPGLFRKLNEEKIKNLSGYVEGQIVIKGLPTSDA